MTWVQLGLNALRQSLSTLQTSLFRQQFLHLDFHGIFDQVLVFLLLLAFPAFNLSLSKLRLGRVYCGVQLRDGVLDMLLFLVRR
jgi:hypothetical protein